MCGLQPAQHINFFGYCIIIIILLLNEYYYSVIKYLKITSRTLFKVKIQNKIRCAQFGKIKGRKMRFQTTLEGAECLRRIDAGWQSVPDEQLSIQL